MSNPTATSHAPRIAIKFGGSSISGSKSANGAHQNGRLTPLSSLGKRSRSHALDDGDESEEDNLSGKEEAITSFGANGAINEKKIKVRSRDRQVEGSASAPFVITCAPNRDWRAATQRPKKARTGSPQKGANDLRISTAEREPAEVEKDIKWGLNLKSTVDDSTSGAPQTKSGEGVSTVDKDEIQHEDTERVKGPDQEALDALMGKEKKQRLVITEEEALQRDYEAVGDVSTLEEYDQIPDGEFGAALLRGMGWDGKMENKIKEVKRRPNLMGLGAKDDEELRKAEAAKKRGYRERRPRLDEYRKEKERERHKREERYQDSYKNERERERERERNRDRDSYSHDRRRDGRDRDSYRDRDRDSHRHRDRDTRR